MGERGGGNAPYTIDHIIEIVNSARRPHLGLMMNRQGRATLILAGNCHAVVRSLGRLTDCDLESAPILVALADHVPRVAMVPGTYALFKRAMTRGLNGHAPKRDSRSDAQRHDAASRTL